MSRIAARAPGRVNLIGEHTDYNEGFVLPAAIGYYTHVDASPRDDRRIVAASTAYASRAEFDLDALPEYAARDWSDYLGGILVELTRAGVPLRGADLRIGGDVPVGAGLSSSASLEVALTCALVDLTETTMDRMDVAALCQRAEAGFVGTRCGIMDQLAVLFGKAQQALLIDTRSLEITSVEVPPSASLVICNTKVAHELATGEYNLRRTQCEQALELLQRRYPHVRALRDVTLPELTRCQADMPSVLFRRARHVVTENARTIAAAQALRNGDLALFGMLMNESHESLKNDYEVACEELDTMVRIARDCTGVYGARMTGGGFGGCTVNLVEPNAVAAFRERIVREYGSITGLTPELYDGSPVDGAAILDA
ncbi:MAG TPA: galactokinase [Candidatus Baltobacteraceae bacterium]|nr:galactokinase [Candidatus Baltobacteraceae bacterium]